VLLCNLIKVCNLIGVMMWQQRTNQNISQYDIYNFGRVTNGGVFLIIIFLNKIIFTKYKFESNRYSHNNYYYYIIIFRINFEFSFDRYSHNFLLLLYKKF